MEWKEIVLYMTRFLFHVDCSSFLYKENTKLEKNESLLSSLCSDFILPILQPNTGCFSIKKGLYFPNFGDFFLNLRILLRFIPKFKRQRLYPKKANKTTVMTVFISPGAFLKLFSCSTQLSMNFILLINVKMPTIVADCCK